MLNKRVIAKVLFLVLICFILLTVLFVIGGDEGKSIRALAMVFTYTFILHHWFLQEALELLRIGRRKK